jgi:hypothetical protein
LFGEADVLSANTDSVAAMWRERYPQYAAKIMVTWGGYDPAESIPRQKPPSSGPPVLAHIGSLYGGRTPAGFLRALDQMQGSGAIKTGDVVVDFLGPLDYGPVDALARDLEGKGLLRLRNASVGRQNALEEASRAHRSLLVDITPGNQRLQVPAKLFDQIRLGRPIFAITPQGSPSQRIIEGSGIPHRSVSPDAPPEAYQEALRDVLRMEPVSTDASDWFQRTFDARNLAGGIAAQVKGEHPPEPAFPALAPLGP